MHKKLEKFFKEHGRRLADLKVRGGLEFEILGEAVSLNNEEQQEFKMLWTRFGSIIWALEPEGERTEYLKEIKECLNRLEKPFKAAESIKKGKIVFKGTA